MVNDVQLNGSISNSFEKLTMKPTTI